MDSPTVKRFLPWVVAMALFMEQLDSTIVNTAVPSMAASLHVTPLSLKAVVASYILSLAVCIPVSGWIADRYGTRRVFALAIAVFTISSVFCGLAMNVPQMVAARILQGIGAAMMMPVGRLTVIRTFPKAELLQAMNFVIIPALIGPLLGPTVGGLIVHWLSLAAIIAIGLALGFFNSLQFSSMNSMAYADIDTNESSMASTIASSFQQISMSFGLAFGSLVAAWYLGDLPQSDRLAVITALHRAFITLGGLTIVSALSYLTLRARDGESVSRAAPDLA